MIRVILEVFADALVKRLYNIIRLVTKKMVKKILNE